MMRKIGLNRPNRLSVGPKKVSPPQIPGEEGGRDGGCGSRLSGVYSESGIGAATTPDTDVFNTSLDSCVSDGGNQTLVQGGHRSHHSLIRHSELGVCREGGGSGNERPESLYGGRLGVGLNTHTTIINPCEKAEGRVVVEHQFKEPFVPYRSMSTVSSPTQEHQSPTKGSRNSMSSIDSGWASNSVPGFSSFCSRNSNSSLNSDKTSFSAEESEIRAVSTVHSQRRLSTVSQGPVPPKRQSSTSSFNNQLPSRNSFRNSGSQDSVASSSRQTDRAPSQCSQYSSSSSVGSSRGEEDTVCTLDLRQMIEQCAHPDHVVHCWLTDLRFEEYFALFVSAGYDLPTVSRMTPEDLTAIGIKKPNHRKKLTAEIAKLAIPDGLPVRVPMTMEEMMLGLRLEQYLPALRGQGYNSVQDILSISIEDLEDIGFYQLGHQKRLLLGVRRVKELRSGKQMYRPDPVASYQPEEVVMCGLPPPAPHTLHHQPKHAFSSFQQTPEHCDPLTQLKFPPHPDSQSYSGPPSLSYQPHYLPVPQHTPSLHTPPHHHHQHYHHQPQPSPPPPEMPDPMPPLNHSIPGVHHHLPSPVPPSWPNPSPSPPETSSFHHPVQVHHHSGSHHPGVPPPNLGGFHSRQKVDIPPGSGGDNPPTYETLLRPTATVKPLPMEQDLIVPDLHIPFANEKSGTIKLKTSPSEEFARLQAEEDGLVCGGEKETKENCLQRKNSLLKTPTRAANRTTGDVMDDISTMLADLTDELDSMLSHDNVLQ